MDVNNVNTTALAYMGDAVYEVAVRRYILETGQHNADAAHSIAIRYVCAKGQCKAVKILFDSLTDEEQKLVKRARNRRTVSKPKNADPVTYKWATAFESLIGYLYLGGQQERAESIMSAAIKAVNKE